MIRTGGWALWLLLLAPAAWGDDAKDKPKDDKPKTPTEQFQALQKEYQEKQQEYFTAIREAKTNEERQKARNEKYPEPQEYAKRFLELGEKSKDEPEIAAKALSWVVTNVVYGPDADKALDLLVKEYIATKEIKAVCARLASLRTPKAEKALREIMEKSPFDDVKFQARISVAGSIRDKADSSKDLTLADYEKLYAEIEEVLKPVVRASNNSKSPDALRDGAEKLLKEIRKFGVGKVAPEIEAEDIDGKSFKLSEYRGKVVLLDFWGNW